MVNRGTLNWSSNNTTYSVPSGYYSGGTLDSRPSYNNGYNAGVAAGKADPTFAKGNANGGYASRTSSAEIMLTGNNGIIAISSGIETSSSKTSLSYTVSSGSANLSEIARYTLDGSTSTIVCIVRYTNNNSAKVTATTSSTNCRTATAIIGVMTG